ncbi:MAG TPA: hypothetical protein VIG33_11205 [Pseudobdellovibrionaceae bacterium]|jgi:hypothetical protein
MSTLTTLQLEPKAISKEIMENQLLEWFAALGLNLREQRMQVGDFEYYHFSSFKKRASGGGYLSSHGRSTSRRTAAIKCAAEMIERQFMLDYFPTAPSFVLAETHNFEKETKTLEIVALPKKDFWSSNGWAVHFDKDISQKKAIDEALERHLLLKSFLNSQWQGFSPVHQIKNSEMELYFYSSQFELGEKTAGIVLAKSPLYKGVSFGYCLGNKSEMANISFWENAIFEAIDKILTLNGKSVDLSQRPDSWIVSDTKEFLEKPFDFSSMSHTPVQEVKDVIPEVSVKTFNLAEKWNLPFSFFASFAWGGSLIPLFNKASLSPTSILQLKAVLKLNGLDKEIPERHPIL